MSKRGKKMEIRIINIEELKKFLTNNGLVKAYDLKDVYVNKKGEIFKIRTLREGDFKIKTLPLTVAENGMMKFCYYYNKKLTTKLLHNVIYDTFNNNKRDKRGEIVFIDGNKRNCSLNNLISVQELLEHYKLSKK